MLAKEVSDRINRIDRMFPAIRKIAGKNSAASRQVLSLMQFALQALDSSAFPSGES